MILPSLSYGSLAWEENRRVEIPCDRCEGTEKTLSVQDYEKDGEKDLDNTIFSDDEVQGVQITVSD
jgi:hypothetical protein